MAYLIEQQPAEDELTSTLQPVIFTVSDVGYSGYKYRFALKISDDSGTVLSTLALQPNDNDTATFNIAQVLDSYIKLTEIQTPTLLSSDSIHMLGFSSSKMCAIGGYTARKFSINLGFIKATTADGPVSFSGIFINETVFAIRWAGDTSDFSDWNETRLGKAYIDSYNSTNPRITPFLSEIPYTGRYADWGFSRTQSDTYLFEDSVTMTSWRTLATPTGTATGFDLNRDLNYYTIRVMNGITQVGIYNISIATAGGVLASAVDSDSLISFIGIGPMNLKAQTFDAPLATAINGTWTYYDICAYSTSPAASADQLSAIYRYKQVDGSCLYDEFTICFQNRSGAYDYIDVLGPQRKTTKVTSKAKYVGKSGNYLDTSTVQDWAAYGRDGGTTFRDVRSKRGMKVSTGWYNESRDVLIESLIVSRKVVMILDGYVVPIVIKNTNYLEKTSLRDKLFSYEIDIEYAKERIS